MGAFMVRHGIILHGAWWALRLYGICTGFHALPMHLVMRNMRYRGLS